MDISKGTFIGGRIQGSLLAVADRPSGKVFASKDAATPSHGRSRTTIDLRSIGLHIATFVCGPLTCRLCSPSADGRHCYAGGGANDPARRKPLPWSPSGPFLAEIPCGDAGHLDQP